MDAASVVQAPGVDVGAERGHVAKYNVGDEWVEEELGGGVDET